MTERNGRNFGKRKQEGLYVYDVRIYITLYIIQTPITSIFHFIAINE